MQAVKNETGNTLEETQIKPEKKLSRQQRRAQERQQAEFEQLKRIYGEKLTKLTEAFLDEIKGDESESDAKLLDIYDHKWRMIATNVNRSGKPIRIPLDAFTNRVTS